VICYGLDRLGIKFQKGQDFRHLYTPAPGLTQPPVWVSFLGESGWDVTMTNRPHLALRSKKEYSYTSILPLGLHGLS